jgi:hypothetical protein
MKFSKLYTFGDSFTMGSGIREDAIESHYPYGGKYTDYVWSNLLSKDLGIDFTNFGVGGLSNENILQTLICQMQNFDKDSLIIVGLTAPARLSGVFNSVEQHWTGFTVVPDTYDKYIKSDGENLSGYHEVLSKEELDSFMQYYGTLFPKHDNALWNYYAFNFIQLQNFFLKHNQRFIIWDYTIWDQFETIHSWSKKDLLDLHWSPNGLKEFSLFLKYCIEVDLPYASFDELVLWRKGEGSSIVKEYIDYY